MEEERAKKALTFKKVESVKEEEEEPYQRPNEYDYHDFEVNNDSYQKAIDEFAAFESYKPEQELKQALDNCIDEQMGKRKEVLTKIHGMV